MASYVIIVVLGGSGLLLYMCSLGEAGSCGLAGWGILFSRAVSRSCVVH